MIRLGQHREAAQLARENTERAQAFGAPYAIAQALRTQAAVDPTGDRVGLHVQAGGEARAAHIGTDHALHEVGLRGDDVARGCERAARSARPYVARALNDMAEAEMFEHRGVGLDHGGSIGALADEGKDRAVAGRHADDIGILPAEPLHERQGSSHERHVTMLPEHHVLLRTDRDARLAWISEDVDRTHRCHEEQSEVGPHVVCSTEDDRSRALLAVARIGDDLRPSEPLTLVLASTSVRSLVGDARGGAVALAVLRQPGADRAHIDYVVVSAD